MAPKLGPLCPVTITSSSPAGAEAGVFATEKFGGNPEAGALPGAEEEDAVRCIVLFGECDECEECVEEWECERGTEVEEDAWLLF